MVNPVQQFPGQSKIFYSAAEHVRNRFARKPFLRCLRPLQDSRIHPIIMIVGTGLRHILKRIFIFSDKIRQIKLDFPIFSILKFSQIILTGLWKTCIP